MENITPNQTVSSAKANTEVKTTNSFNSEDLASLRINTADAKSTESKSHRRAYSWGSSPTALNLAEAAVHSMTSIDDNSVME